MKRKILAALLATWILCTAVSGTVLTAGEFDPNKDNYVNVDAIDLSLHGETSGAEKPVSDSSMRIVAPSLI